MAYPNSPHSKRLTAFAIVTVVLLTPITVAAVLYLKDRAGKVSELEKERILKEERRNATEKPLNLEFGKD